jgi:hypothetical protein
MTLNIKALCLNFLAKEKYTHVFVSQSNKVEGLNYLNILPLFQNVCHFFIDIIIIHLDIYYIQMHNNIYESRKIKTGYNLEQMEYITRVQRFAPKIRTKTVG